MRLTLFLAAALLAPAPAALAQSATPMPSTAELKQNLATVEASTEGESEEMDNLLTQTSRQLVRYLRAHELSETAAKDLGLDVTAGPPDAASLKAYTFSYSSGGTRGTVNRPVLQWKNAAGKLFAYALDEECSVNDVHKLALPGRTLYLLLGAEQGDSQCVSYQAFVIELRGDYLLLDNQAFGKSNSLRLCNAVMTFETGKRVLGLDFSDYLKERSKEGRLADAQYLAQNGYRRPSGAKRVVLQFRNGRFVQQP